MPTRIIRDGILTSERMAKLDWAAEVFYRRLMSVADDHGRYYATPMLLRAACYPLQLDKVSDADIGKWTRCAEKAALVSVYPAPDGKRYIQILDFGQRVQSKSKFPEPCSDLLESTVNHGEEPEDTVNPRLVVVEDVVEGEGVKPRSPKRKKPETHPLPDDFGISDAVKAWSIEKGHTRLPEHLEAFKLKCKAKSYAYADWDAAFMEAVRGDWAKLGNPPQSTVASGNSVAASRPMS